jgi:hypothetical protein
MRSAQSYSPAEYLVVLLIRLLAAMDIDRRKATVTSSTRLTTTSGTAWAYTKHVLCLLIAISLVGHFTFESPLWGLGRHITRQKAKWFPVRSIQLIAASLTHLPWNLAYVTRNDTCSTCAVRRPRHE